MIYEKPPRMLYCDCLVTSLVSPKLSKVVFKKELETKLIKLVDGFLILYDITLNIYYYLK